MVGGGLTRPALGRGELMKEVPYPEPPPGGAARRGREAVSVYHPRDPPCGAVGPGPPRHGSAVPTEPPTTPAAAGRTQSHRAGRGPPVCPGPPCGWRNVGPRALESKKKENGCTERPEQSPGRLHCPGGIRGQPPRAGQMEGEPGPHCTRGLGATCCPAPVPSLRPTPSAGLWGPASFPSTGW